MWSCQSGLVQRKGRGNRLQTEFKNTLYYGDNLDILREYIPAESVDLVYLDPPFNSNRNYSVLFKDESGTESEAQIEAFEDTWHWSETAEETFREARRAQMPSAEQQGLGI